MMNKKITSHFLKVIRNKGKSFFTYDEDNYYLSDGYMLYAVKKEEMELNINLFVDKEKEFKTIMDDIKDNKYKDAEVKYYIPDRNNKGTFFIKISNDEVSVYVSNRLFEFFKDCTFKIKGKISPVACWRKELNKEVFVGIILPLRYEER